MNHQNTDNAFNRLNRSAALHNIKELCPNFYRYLANTYQLPAKLIINDRDGNNGQNVRLLTTDNEYM